jgi:DNA primase
MNPDDLQKIRDCDIVTVTSEHVALRKVGARFSGLCPFHSERTGSFTVNPARGFYHCFGCGAHGSIIDFVMHIDHTTFIDACQRIAARNNITLTQDNPAATRANQRRQQLRATIAAATDWYHTQLLTTEAAAPARAYLAQRGITNDTIHQFQLGWAPNTHNALLSALTISDDIATETGLGVIRTNGRISDFFRNRILFPIHDVNGHPIAFGGRLLPGIDGPKYINTPETSLYPKSKTLYGLATAKQHIVTTNEVIVCEGYTDVLAFHQAGLPHAVATCGTALTEDHIRTLANFTRRIIVAFDADTAGQKAAARFHDWEQQFGLDLQAASFPTGTDPAELTQHPEQLRHIVTTAKPFLEWRLAKHWAEANLTTPEGRARAFEQAISMIHEHPNTLVREVYANQAADHARISPTHAATALRKRPQPATRPAVPHNTTVSPVECAALAALIHTPGDVIAFIDPCLFRHRTSRTLCALLIDNDLHDTLEHLRTENNTEAEELLTQLAANEPLATAVDAVARLVSAAIGRLITKLVEQLRQGTLDSSDASDTIQALRSHMRQLDAGEHQAETMNTIVPWLITYHRDRTQAAA